MGTTKIKEKRFDPAYSEWCGYHWLYVGLGRNRYGALVHEWMGHCDFCGEVKMLVAGPFDGLICTPCADSFMVVEFGSNPNPLLPVLVTAK